jgi:hypothetical protein
MKPVLNGTEVPAVNTMELLKIFEREYQEVFVPLFFGVVSAWFMSVLDHFWI